MKRVQKKALRIPYELQKLESYNERLSTVGLTTLKVRRDRHDLIQIHVMRYIHMNAAIIYSIKSLRI